MFKTEIQIKSIWGDVLFEYSKKDNTIKDTLIEAIHQRADLSEADLSEADLSEADLRGADLSEANLKGADLRGANLSEADLWRADLWRADLSKADLRGANLWRADLSEANLWEAKNLSPIYQSDLSILKYQKGKIRAFKFLDGDKSPFQFQEDKITYKVGKTYSLKKDKCNFDEYELCGSGLNIATLDWCLRETECDLGKTYIEVEFTAKDIVAIPYNSDGKFRVKKLKVIRKLTKEELEKYLKE